MQRVRVRALVGIGLLLGGCTGAEDRESTRDAETQSETDADPPQAGRSDAEADATIALEEGGVLEQDAAAADASSDGGDLGSVPDGGAGGGANGEPMFVSVGYEGFYPRLYTSCEGKSWLGREVGLPVGFPSGAEAGGLRGIGYGAGLFVIAGGGTLTSTSENYRLLGHSSDGVNWQWEDQSALCAAGQCRAGVCNTCQWMGGAAWLDDGGEGVWIAGGGGGTRLYSNDGARTWKQSGASEAGAYRRFRSQGRRAAAAGSGVLALVELASEGAGDPVVWHDTVVPAHEAVFLAAGNGAFVAVWWNTGCRWLREGATWQPCDLPVEQDQVITSVVFGSGKFTILGRGAPLEATDGEHWTRASGSGTDFRDVTFGNGVYATSDLWSSDARTWQRSSQQASFGNALAFGPLGSGHSCSR